MGSLVGLENTWKEKLRESVTLKNILPAECVGREYSRGCLKETLQMALKLFRMCTD